MLTAVTWAKNRYVPGPVHPPTEQGWFPQWRPWGWKDGAWNLCKYHCDCWAQRRPQAGVEARVGRAGHGPPRMAVGREAGVARLCSGGASAQEAPAQRAGLVTTHSCCRCPFLVGSWPPHDFPGQRASAVPFPEGPGNWVACAPDGSQAALQPLEGPALCRDSGVQQEAGAQGIPPGSATGRAQPFRASSSALPCLFARDKHAIAQEPGGCKHPAQQCSPEMVWLLVRPYPQREPPKCQGGWPCACIPPAAPLCWPHRSSTWRAQEGLSV